MQSHDSGQINSSGFSFLNLVFHTNELLLSSDIFLINEISSRRASYAVHSAYTLCTKGI